MCSELKGKLQDYENRISEIKEEHEREIMKLEKENQDKVYLLLNQLQEKDNLYNSNESNDHLLKRIKIQSEELEKMDMLRQEVQTLRDTVERLNKEIDEASKKREHLVPKQKVTCFFYNYFFL